MLLEVLGACRTGDGGPVVVPVYLDVLRAMVSQADREGTQHANGGPAPVRPSHSRAVGRAVLRQIEGQTETPEPVLPLPPGPIPEPIPERGQVVAGEQLVAPDLLPVTLDGWPAPDRDESSALWQLRRIHMLIREMIRLGPMEAIAEYRTDLRDWVDRLGEVIRWYRACEEADTYPRDDD